MSDLRQGLIIISLYLGGYTTPGHHVKSLVRVMASIIPYQKLEVQVSLLFLIRAGCENNNFVATRKVSNKFVTKVEIIYNFESMLNNGYLTCFVSFSEGYNHIWGL